MSLDNIQQAKAGKMIPPQEPIEDYVGNEREVSLIKTAMSTDEYKNAPNFCTQIGVICSFVRTNYIRISYTRIGKIFGKSKQSVRDMHMNYIRGPGIDGRPPLLNDEEIDKLKEYILELHTTQPYPIYPTIE